MGTSSKSEDEDVSISVMKKSSMSAANTEPVSSVVANANLADLVRPDQPDQEGVEMSQDRPAPATARAPSSQDLSVSAGTVDGNPSADEPVSSLEELTAGESAADATPGAMGNVKVQLDGMSPPRQPFVRATTIRLHHVNVGRHRRGSPLPHRLTLDLRVHVQI